MATVNEKMTAIADAIRAKTGGTEPLGLDAMAEAIAALETGGGLPESIDVIDGGVFTMASAQTAQHIIDHNLGTTPDFFVLYETTTSVSGLAYGWMGAYVIIKHETKKSDGTSTDGFRMLYGGGSTSGGTIPDGNMTSYFTNLKIYVNRTSGFSMKGGSTYAWAVIKFVR